MSKKFSHFSIFLGSLSAFIFLNGCYYDSKEFLFPELSSPCDTSNVTYLNSVQPVMSQYCLSCHSNSTAQSYGASIRLEDYSDVLIYAQNGKLLGTISHESGYSPMPKGTSKLSDCIVSNIRTWIDAGAPNN